MAQDNREKRVRIVFNENDLQMPYSLEAEQAVLGAVLMDGKSIVQVADVLRPEHFYLPEHQAIWRVMTDKMMASQAIDLVTVLESLRSEDFFEGDEGKNYLFQMAQTVPSVSNIAHYAGIIRGKYDARMLITAAREIMEAAVDPNATPDEMLDLAEQKIYDIGRRRSQGGLTPLREAIAANYEIFNKLSSDDPAVRDQYVGIPTGLPSLDRLTTGLNRSDLIIVGARPGVGKTSFALNLARNVALKQHRPVAFFNLEMSKEQIVNRLLSAEARVTSSKLRTGQLSPEEWGRIADAAAVLCNIPLYIDDTAGITVPEIKARVRRQKDIDFVVVDYLGLLQSAKRTENRVQEVSQITRDLKMMAKDLGIPVLVCAQLSRANEKQGNRKPALSDLRESGSIEQDADQVLFLHRDEYYKSQADDPTQVETGTAEILVSKNRHGELGSVKMAFAGEFTQFSELEMHHNG
ncbi:MAG: replicative DNA helicase [Acutalibacteraceae bacterium]|jgi:replicative DNA helicase